MKLPWIRRSTHMREVIALGEAYRRDIEQANRRAARAERNLAEWAAAFGEPMTPYQQYHRDTVVIPFEVSNILRARQTPREMLEYVARGLIGKLLEMNEAAPLVGQPTDLRELQ